VNIFVGPSGELEVKDADTQRSINLMPTLVESGMGKAQFFLKPVPGLVTFSTYLSLTVTSRLYPIEVDDELDVSAVPTGGFLIEWQPENIDVSAAIQSGALPLVLRTHNTDPEAVDVSLASIQSGALVTVLRTHTTEEVVDVALPSILNGALAIIVITHTNTPEGVDPALPSILSGTLA